MLEESEKSQYQNRVMCRFYRNRIVSSSLKLLPTSPRAQYKYKRKTDITETVSFILYLVELWWLPHLLHTSHCNAADSKYFKAVCNIWRAIIDVQYSWRHLSFMNLTWINQSAMNWTDFKRIRNDNKLFEHFLKFHWQHRTEKNAFELCMDRSVSLWTFLSTVQTDLFRCIFPIRTLAHPYSHCWCFCWLVPFEVSSESFRNEMVSDRYWNKWAAIQA